MDTLRPLLRQQLAAAVCKDLECHNADDILWAIDGETVQMGFSGASVTVSTSVRHPIPGAAKTVVKAYPVAALKKSV